MPEDRLEDRQLAERGWPDHVVRELIGRAQQGDKTARDQLVEANLRLVRSLVSRFASTSADPEDLFQLGCIGLLKAVDRFDLSYDVRFSTYAVPLILGEIRRYLRDDGPMRVSRGLKQLAQQARKAQEKLAGDLGREPTVAEVAAALGVEPEEVVEAMEGARAPASIHQTVHEGDGDPIYLLDQLTTDSDPREGQWLDHVALREGLSQLEPREQMVIILRFFRDKTQTEVATILGCSQVQVSRIERKALERIRTFMDAS
ncbi:MAG TPA: RNA polymerase sporulation sigma factor SigF [Symbiobacteriaceae bacterium]|nr:RNA polymerase sporulation sigma factor SigF [Symbiobacteriaceae bacterium]